MAYVPKVSQFRDIINQLSPPWLAGGNAERYMYAIGLGVDLLCEKLNEGMRARMPGQGTNTALPYLGKDRNLTQGKTETNANFIARLQGSFAENKLSGMPRAILDQVHAYISPSNATIRFVSASSTWDQMIGGVWSKFKGNANWNWDGYGTAKWWRGWLIVDSSAGPWTAPATWGSGALWGAINNTATWGSSATTNDVANLQALAKLWKSGNTVVKHILITFDGTFFRPQYTADGTHNPAGTFGRQSTGDGTGTTTIGGTRFANVAYWDGVI